MRANGTPSAPFETQTLPGIPPRMLLLSGLSATGYLGGKLMRKPGPIIDAALFDDTKRTLDVIGHNLDPLATFELGQSPFEPLIEADATTMKRPSVIEKQQSQDELDPPCADGLATGLRFKLSQDGADALRQLIGQNVPQALGDAMPPPTARTLLTIINRDGQRASWVISPAMSVAAPPTPVQPVAGGAPAVVT